MANHPLAGKSPTLSMLVDVPRLITSYYIVKPDVSVSSQKVSFGTSGHRGSSLDTAPGGLGPRVGLRAETPRAKAVAVVATRVPAPASEVTV